MFEWVRARLSEPIVLPEGIRRLVARAAQPFHGYVESVQRLTAPGVEAAGSWFEKREPREKVLIKVAGVILGVLLLYSLVYAPIASLQESLADRVTARRSDLIELRGLMRSYEHVQRELKRAQERTVPNNPNFSLFSIIEQTLSKSVGHQRIGSITPTDRVVPGGFRQFDVDIKLNSVTLPQLVDTLYGVQSLEIPVTIANLQLHKHADDTHTFDVDMSCVALAKNS
jgi:hypothetical protein